ncbi:hypothetical protein ScPMuIL_016986 [Solemya velum]
MRKSTENSRTGIQWTFIKQLEDLDFADNVCLPSHRHQDAQEKLTRLSEEAEKTWLQKKRRKQNDRTSLRRVACNSFISDSPRRFQKVPLMEQWPQQKWRHKSVIQYHASIRRLPEYVKNHV